MVKSDVTAVELKELSENGVAQKYIEKNIAESDARQKARQRERIEVRTQELLRVNGSEYGFSMKKARQQATREVMGQPAYEDDINEVVEKPDRQTILDAHRQQS